MKIPPDTQILPIISAPSVHSSWANSVILSNKRAAPDLAKQQKADAEQTLQELLSEKLLPFKLSAYSVEFIGFGEYIVRFHDSRLHSIDVTCGEGQCFKDVFRIALLDRLKRMTTLHKINRLASATSHR